MNPREIEREIQTIIDKETAAWNARDAATLVSIFHPDMVWPWPPNPLAHDPASWIFPMGRYDRRRWQESWEELFRTHDMIHNARRTVRIIVSEQGDGAFAVVDVDTQWKNRNTGVVSAWQGRAGKGYSKVNGKWLLIYHTGLLKYPHAGMDDVG
ncbi:MAG: nuclear transport factor 2 family protein [candidate division FCPU426 bacterium]